MIFDYQFGQVSISFFDPEKEEMVGWLWKRRQFEEETGLRLPQCFLAHYENGQGVVFLDPTTLADEATIQAFTQAIEERIEYFKNLIQQKQQEQQEQNMLLAQQEQQRQLAQEQRIRDLEDVLAFIIGGSLV